MLTDFREFCTHCYVVIDQLYQQIAPTRPGPKPDCSDSELITLAIVGECRGYDCETELLAFWRDYPDLFPVLPERTRFNRRRRQLLAQINQIRLLLLQRCDLAMDTQAVVDSLPVPVIPFHLVPSATSLSEWKSYGASFGQVRSKKQTIFGYKLHLLVSLSGLILNFSLVGANEGDITVVEELLSDCYQMLVLGDLAYYSHTLANRLLKERAVKLFFLSKKNSPIHSTDRERQWHHHFRAMVETVNSQLSEQFKVEVNHATSFGGLATRLVTKLTAHTLAVVLNRQLGVAHFRQIKRLAFPT